MFLFQKLLRFLNAFFYKVRENMFLSQKLLRFLNAFFYKV